MEFSIDAGIVSGVVQLFFAIFYFIQGDATYTWYNFGIAFVASTLQMCTAMIGLNAVVKGLAGPTTAIMQMQAIVGIGLNAMFLGVIPTIYQFLGALIALLGALSIILSNPPAAKKQ